MGLWAYGVIGFRVLVSFIIRTPCNKCTTYEGNQLANADMGVPKKKEPLLWVLLQGLPCQVQSSA